MIAFRCGTLISFLTVLELASCLQLRLERANVTYQNPKYIGNGKLYVSRHGRKSPYYINVEGTTKHVWVNNVTFNFIFYEYLHNEYRRSFVEMHFKFCNMLNSDPYVGGMLAERGIVCPCRPAHFQLLNLSVPLDHFPHVFPIEKCKVEIEFSITETKESMARGYVYATFIPKRNKV